MLLGYAILPASERLISCESPACPLTKASIKWDCTHIPLDLSMIFLKNSVFTRWHLEYQMAGLECKSIVMWHDKTKYYNYNIMGHHCTQHVLQHKDICFGWWFYQWFQWQHWVLMQTHLIKKNPIQNHTKGLLISMTSLCKPKYVNPK